MLLHEQKFEVLNYTLNSTIELRAMPFNSEYYKYYTPSGEAIEPATCVRDLGVNMENNGSWSTHINTITVEAKRLAGWILGVFRDRSKRTMVTLLKSLLRPKLEYCCPLWSPTKIGDIIKIETIQRFFTRRIAECQGLNYWERLAKLGILSLQRRRERYMIIHCWKAYVGLAPNSTKIFFYNHIRHGPKARIPPIITSAQQTVQTLRESSFGIRAAQLFNRMPAEVRRAKSIEIVKIKIGEFLSTIPDLPPVRGYSSPRDNSLFALLKEGS